MKKAVLTLIVLSLMLTTVISGCGNKVATNGTEKKPIEIKFSHVVAESTPKHQAALKFKELLEKNSNGQFQVQIFPSSQLYGDKEEMEALQANNVQLIAPLSNKLVSFSKSFQISDLPFLFQNEKAAYSFYTGEYGQKLLKSLEPKGILGVAWWLNAQKVFTNSKRPISRPEDLKGLKFRTQSGGLLDEQFSALGAGSQTLAWADTYQALQNRTVDGQENTLNNIDTAKLDEVQKYLSISNHGRNDYVVLTNSKFWNSLTPDQQKLINDAMKEATNYEIKLAGELDKKSLDNLKNRGKMIINTLSDSEKESFKSALMPVYDKYVDLIGKEYVEAAKISK